MQHPLIYMRLSDMSCMVNTQYVSPSGWLSGNRGKAQRLQQTFAPIRKETERLSAALKELMGVTDVKWACGWGVSQFRACLRSLLNLHEEYKHKYNIHGEFYLMNKLSVIRMYLY